MSSNNVLRLFLIVSILTGCSSPNNFYIDVAKQAIISCKGDGFKQVTISNENIEITLEGAGAIIYFDQVNNVSQTLIYDSAVPNYKLSLEPNSDYQIKIVNGYDRGLLVGKVTTDGFGKIISSTRTNCGTVQ